MKPKKLSENKSLHHTSTADTIFQIPCNGCILFAICLSCYSKFNWITKLSKKCSFIKSKIDNEPNYEKATLFRKELAEYYDEHWFKNKTTL